MDKNLILTPEQATLIWAVLSWLPLDWELGNGIGVGNLISKAQSFLPTPHLGSGQIEATDDSFEVDDYPVPIQIIYKETGRIFGIPKGYNDPEWFDEKDVTIFKDVNNG